MSVSVLERQRRPLKHNDRRLEPFRVAGEIIQKGGDVEALVSALSSYGVGRVKTVLRPIEEYAVQVQADHPHPDDESYEARLLNATRSRVRLTTHGEAGQLALPDGTFDTRYRPEVMGALRDSEFFDSMKALSADRLPTTGHFAYERSTTRSLDYKFELDPVTVAEEWSRRMGEDPITGLKGMPRLIYDEVYDLRETQPLAAVALDEEGDGHNGSKSHGHHRVAARVSKAAELILPMDLKIEDLPTPYRLPMMWTTTPSHHETEMAVEGGTAPLERVLDAYRRQFNSEGRRRFIEEIPERLSFDRLPGALPRKQQSEYLEALMSQAH